MFQYVDFIKDFDSTMDMSHWCITEPERERVEYMSAFKTMESLVGARYFSNMDLKSGFWQVKVSEDSCQYAAFTVSSMGVYESLCMPYSLCNAPVTFQHIMQNCLSVLNLSFTMVYLDDVIVYSETPEDHLTWLQAIFDHFAHHGLKLKSSKCHFFKVEIT